MTAEDAAVLFDGLTKPHRSQRHMGIAQVSRFAAMQVAEPRNLVLAAVNPFTFETQAIADKRGGEGARDGLIDRVGPVGNTWPVSGPGGHAGSGSGGL